ncbi:MAG: N-acetylmuramoyl-L-alanine amidase [Planctomycetota bacterium]
MVRISSSSGGGLGIAAALLALAACSTPRPATASKPLPALAAPAPSPPGDLDLEHRISWWEKRMSRLHREDQSEARLRLGNLYLDANRPKDALRTFYAARKGPLSRSEAALVSRGVGHAYLLEGEGELALGFLQKACPDLKGIDREECLWLTARLEGTEPPPLSDPALAARLEPLLAGLHPAGSAPAPATAPAALVQIRRASWGARPTRSNVEPMGRPFRITIHHSAEPLLSTTVSATKAEVRRIQKSHQDPPRGWADIGYHFLIDRAGRVVEGRPLRFQGAHAGNRETNRGNLGICVLGNFVPQPERGPDYARAQHPTDAQWKSLEQLVGALRKRYGIPRRQIFAHKDFRDTSCPGPELSGWVLRTRVASVP